ncbi:MAG: sugar ABC transporter ATP-binding protein [Dehalococcoidia bacterium]
MHFGGVLALRRGDLTVRRGTIHGLVGENGAGKSTLAKIIAGVHRPDGGELLVDGQVRHYHSPRAAIADGITMMTQELSLLPARTVLQNVYLGSEKATLGWVHTASIRRAYAELCDRVGLHLDPDCRVADLRVADQQKVELLRAFARDVQVIILDEPTAALSTLEAQQLLAAVARFRDRGLTIIYISHFLDEVLAISDDVTVLRDGAFVMSGSAAEHTPTSLVTAMAGRPLDVTFPEKVAAPADAPEVLRVTGVTSRDGLVRDVSFSVRRGEIVCLAGLVGSGRTETARCVYGANPYHGRIEFLGRPAHWRHPSTAIAHGVTMVPEARKTQGILPTRAVRENLSLAFLRKLSTLGWIMSRREDAACRTQVDELDIRPTDTGRRVADLSGGNQQKTLFGRTLMPGPALLIIDEPTRGVDVGAKRAIYELITERARRGLAILMISSETDEVLGLAHRILVMREGWIVGELDGMTTTKEEFVTTAFTPPARRDDR